MKTTNKNVTRYALIGAILGAMFGSLLTNLFMIKTSLAIPIALSIGAYFGSTFGSKKDRKINEKIVKDGYKIVSVYKELKSDTYEIILKDGNGEEITKYVPEDQIDISKYDIGYYVFLDEEGNIKEPEEEGKKKKKQK